MNTEQQLQQLTIDRTEQGSNKRSLLMFSNIILLMTVIFFWFTAPAQESANGVDMNLMKNSHNKAEGESLRASDLSENPRYLSSKEQVSLTSHETDNKVSSVLDASGHVVARRIATVSSRVTGKLQKLNIEEGIKVKKSEIIAELDDKQAQISYKVSLADLAAKQAGYEEILVLEKYASQKSQRSNQLAKDNLISQQLNEDSHLKAEQIRTQVKNRHALVRLSEQRLELALYQLEQHKIRAPFDGVVISKNAQVGELISAGASGGGFIRTGVGTIVDMNSLEIEVEVGESYINRVYAGQKTLSTLDAYPNWQIDSEVIAIIPTADRQKASIKVRVRLQEIDQRVLPDMGVKVSFLENHLTANR